MKNKKLFAILTLVCFMFTLMPVAAFAVLPAATADDAVKPALTFDYMADSAEIGTAGQTIYEVNYTAATATTAAKYTVKSATGYAAPAPTGADAGKYFVAFDLTKVAAPTVGLEVDAADVLAITAQDIAERDAVAADNERSYVWTIEKEVEETLRNGVATANIHFDIADRYSNETVTELYVWVTEGNNQAPSSALTSVALVTGNTSGSVVQPETNKTGVFPIKDVTNATELTLTLNKDGVYTIHAAVVPTAGTYTDFDSDTTDKGAITAIKGLDELATAASWNTITIDAKSGSSAKYTADVTIVGDTTYAMANGEKLEYVDTALDVAANSIDKETIQVVINDAEGKALKYTDVKVSTSSDSIEVSDVELNTGSKGYIEFDVTGSVEGAYYVYVTVGQFEVRIEVVVGAYGAAYIETIKEPVAPMDIDAVSLAGRVEFEITDINGNELEGSFAGAAGAQYNVNGEYVKFVEKPAKSDLKNKDLLLAYVDQTAVGGDNYGYTIALKSGSFDVEGTYEIKVLLDNGKAAYATFTVKEFQTPVRLMLTYEQEAVELGGVAEIDNLIFMDANGVTKTAVIGKDVEIAANGYAVAELYPNGDVRVETSEKYVGEEISVIAVSERYNLTATATVKVTADAAKLAFVDKTAEVGVNNKIDVQLVDAAGNKVAPTAMTKAEISYIVLDKPADAKVSIVTATDKDLAEKGVFTMAMTSNTVGNVTVQAIAKLTNATGVVKYYTGSQVIGVGTGETGDVVVMSIGSNQIVKNDAVATMVAAPIVKDARTFVPFRALAEAFGAEVAWDEATQAVTAELNGVKVVLTIGSANYTVNGVEKAADVAPFINGASTMVPVRFVAEAFGIKVIPTYDANGATADILFNL